MIRDLKYHIYLWCSEHILPLLIKIFGVTWRISISNIDKFPNDAAIFPIWHGHLLIHLYAFRNRGIKVLVSRSRDGELIARTIKKFGYDVIRGSSSRSGATATLKIIDELKNDAIQIAITPDGPKGPAYKLKDGTIIIAQKTGIPVYPVIVVHSEPSIRLHSWDSFIIPLPFAKIKIKVFGPLRFSPDDDREKIRSAIENVMKIE